MKGIFQVLYWSTGTSLCAIVSNHKICTYWPKDRTAACIRTQRLSDVFSCEVQTGRCSNSLTLELLLYPGFFFFSLIPPSLCISLSRFDLHFIYILAELDEKIISCMFFTYKVTVSCRLRLKVENSLSTVECSEKTADLHQWVLWCDTFYSSLWK